MDFDPESREVGDQVSEDEYSPFPNEDRLKSEEDLRIRMFALDMAVTALPTLTHATDNEETKIRIVRRAAVEFEKILRGKTGS